MLNLIKKFWLLNVMVLMLQFTIAGVLPNEVVDALKSGDSDDLSNFFNNSIELSLEKSKGIYSKKQAQQILSNFFEENKPSSFSKIHSGGKTNSKFVIGRLNTTNGKFRISILFSKEDDIFKILQLRIEADEAY